MDASGGPHEAVAEFVPEFSFTFWAPDAVPDHARFRGPTTRSWAAGPAGRAGDYMGDYVAPPAPKRTRSPAAADRGPGRPRGSSAAGGGRGLVYLGKTSPPRKQPAGGLDRAAAHEIICNKRPRAEGPDWLRVENRGASGSRPGARGASPAGALVPPPGGAAGAGSVGAPARTDAISAGPVGGPARRVQRPTEALRLPAGPYWRSQYWTSVSRPPLRADLAELAAADLPDLGWEGDPEHRLWAASPYGPIRRARGAAAFPRAPRSLHWGPVSRCDRDTAAHAALWRPPDDPG